MLREDLEKIFKKIKFPRIKFKPLTISKKCLGIDIGTSSVKIVEISRWGGRKTLENYGELSAQTLYEKPFRTFEKSTLTLFTKDIARAISAVLNEAKIRTREVVFSIPDFSTFFTILNLPTMKKEEIPGAVKYEARRYSPLPLSEVVLDWQIIDGKFSNNLKKPVKILLVVVSKEVIQQYQEIARACKLRPLALEAEVFSLSRASIKEEGGVICVIDIGARSTTYSIADNQNLKLTYSSDLCGNNLTEMIKTALNVDYKKAEALKQRYGLSSVPLSEEEGMDSNTETIGKILFPSVDLILAEIEKISQKFYQAEGKKVQKVILGGGTARLPGLKEYFSEKLKIEVELSQPFSDILYPPILDNTIKKMGPAYAVVTGAALRGLE